MSFLSREIILLERKILDSLHMLVFFCLFCLFPPPPPPPNLMVSHGAACFGANMAAKSCRVSVQLFARGGAQYTESVAYLRICVYYLCVCEANKHPHTHTSLSYAHDSTWCLKYHIPPCSVDASRSVPWNTGSWILGALGIWVASSF